MTIVVCLESTLIRIEHVKPVDTNGFSKQYDSPGSVLAVDVQVTVRGNCAKRK